MVMDKKWYKPYDSPEELYVSWYLDELVGAGYVIKYNYQPTSWELSKKRTYKYRKVLKTKTNKIETTLFQKHVYTADFELLWNDAYYNILLKNVDMFGRGVAQDNQVVNKENPFWINDINFLEILPSELWSSWEVKPLFDRNNMTRLFTINQKWVYDKYGIYVQKVVPQKLFKDTFTPQKYLFTDSGKQKRKLTFAPRTLEEYIKSRQR